MTESFPAPVRGWWRPGAGFLFRAGRRTLVESLYLLTAPVTALAGLLLVLGGKARWSAGLERWRIARLRALTVGAGTASQGNSGTAPGAGLWLDAGHAVAVLPVVLITSVVTGLWWFVGVASITFPLRAQPAPGPQQPMTLNLGSHTAVSIQLGSPGLHVAFGITLGLLVLSTLPLVTRVCVAAQAGLGQVAGGETVLDPQVVAQLLAGQRRDGALGALTERERELLALMAEGHSNTAIARRLVLSASAVEKHIGNIFAKLGLPPDDGQHRRVLAVLAYLRA